MWIEEDFLGMKKLIVTLTAPNPQEVSILDMNHIFFTLPSSVFEKIFQYQQQQQQQNLLGLHLYLDHPNSNNKKHKYSLLSLPSAFYDTETKDILINVNKEEGQKMFVGCVDILYRQPHPRKMPLPILVEKGVTVTDLLHRHLNVDTMTLNNYRRMYVHFPAQDFCLQDFTEAFERYKNVFQ